MLLGKIRFGCKIMQCNAMQCNNAMQHRSKSRQQVPVGRLDEGGSYVTDGNPQFGISGGYDGRHLGGGGLGGDGRYRSKKRKRKRRKKYSQHVGRIVVVGCGFVAMLMLWTAGVISIYKTFFSGERQNDRERLYELQRLRRDSGANVEMKPLPKLHWDVDDGENENENENANENENEYDDPVMPIPKARTNNDVDENNDRRIKPEKHRAWSWLDEKILEILNEEDKKQEQPSFVNYNPNEMDDYHLNNRNRNKNNYNNIKKNNNNNNMREMFDQLESFLPLLIKKINWEATEGRGRHKRTKEAIVIGSPNIIKRDFETISGAVSAFGLQVNKASDISSAVARGRIDGNLRSVRGREWGLILCLSLKTEKCLSTFDFGRLESEKGSFARINRVAELEKVLWSKDSYCQTAQWSEGWLGAFTFPCWVLPKDGQTFGRELNAMKQSGHSKTAWIVKPFKQGGGKGIFVLDSIDEVQVVVQEERKVVIQPYLSNPHLLEKRKWDLRTYVLVTRVSPLTRAYLYQDGLVRLATEAYDPTASHGGNKTQFLTNTSVNKKKNKDMSQLTWSFGKLEEELGTKKFNVLFKRIQRAIAMLLVTAERSFSERFVKIASTFTCSNCYHLLGVDLIVDENLFPRVIEVNGEPSMLLSGESQSHYDSTKTKMQQEVSRIVLQSSPRIAAQLLQDIKNANLDQVELDWVLNSEKMMQYLLETKRESLSVESFLPIYPDPMVCSNKGRKNLWNEFLKHLHRDGRAPWRLKLHKVLEKIICEIYKE